MTLFPITGCPWDGLPWCDVVVEGRVVRDPMEPPGGLWRGAGLSKGDVGWEEASFIMASAVWRGVQHAVGGGIGQMPSVVDTLEG